MITPYQFGKIAALQKLAVAPTPLWRIAQRAEGALAAGQAGRYNQLTRIAGNRIDALPPAKGMLENMLDRLQSRIKGLAPPGWTPRMTPEQTQFAMRPYFSGKPATAADEGVQDLMLHGMGTWFAKRPLSNFLPAKSNLRMPEIPPTPDLAAKAVGT